MTYAIEVDHPLRGWTRLEGRYRTKVIARGWYKFIRGVWHGLPLRTVEVQAWEQTCSDSATKPSGEAGA